MKWYDDSLPSVQTWENGWGKCMRIIIAPFVCVGQRVCMIISLSVCFWWLVWMCTVSAMSVHVLECVWLNLHCAIARCCSDTHTYSSMRHTCSHHITSWSVWFLGLVSYQGIRQLLCKSAWILHYKVVKEVTKKNPPFLCVYNPVYTCIIHRGSMAVCMLWCMCFSPWQQETTD